MLDIPPEYCARDLSIGERKLCDNTRHLFKIEFISYQESMHLSKFDDNQRKNFQMPKIKLFLPKFFPYLMFFQCFTESMAGLNP